LGVLSISSRPIGHLSPTGEGMGGRSKRIFAAIPNAAYELINLLIYFSRKPVLLILKLNFHFSLHIPLQRTRFQIDLFTLRIDKIILFSYSWE